MRIANSTVALNAVSHYSQDHYTHERLHAWGGREQLIVESRMEGSSRRFSEEDVARFSFRMRPRAGKDQPGQPIPQDNAKVSDRSDIFKAAGGDLKLQLMKMLIEELTGRKVEVFGDETDEVVGCKGECSESPQATAGGNEPQATSGESNGAEGWGIEYSYREVVEKHEAISFRAAGTVTLKDGRQLSFEAALGMQRHKHQELRHDVRAGDALIDPLVLNLDSTPLSLGPRQIAFDLDSDGADETIAAPTAGAGFLAYDRNANGVIDNGRELFGPRTGSGFAELADLDKDANGWIDEKDAVFYDLKILQFSQTGDPQLSTLLANDVGAIYLGNAETAFSLEGEPDALAGKMTHSGVYLKQSGGGGFVHELDLVA